MSNEWLFVWVHRCNLVVFHLDFKPDVKYRRDLGAQHTLLHIGIDILFVTKIRPVTSDDQDRDLDGEIW